MKKVLLREAMEKVNLARKMTGGFAVNQEAKDHKVCTLLLEAMNNMTLVMKEMETELTKEMYELHGALLVGFRQGREIPMEKI